MQTCPERRRQPRFITPPMLHAVAVRIIGRDGDFRRRGHAYNLSLSGALLELDDPAPPGAGIAVVLDLPTRGAVRATGRVVRLCELEEPGPCRMAITFTGFASPLDRERLGQYLTRTSLRRCA